MATIETTDTRIIVEPIIATPDYEFGPLDSVAANAVLLTRENLRKVGAYPPRVGRDWVCDLWVVFSVASVETPVDVSGWTLLGTYWDPVARVANMLPVALGAAAVTGQLVITLPDAPVDLPTAGMYGFSISATDTDVFDVCSGWLEILPAMPV